MIDKTTSAMYKEYAQEEIVIARELYSSDSEKKRLKANRHFYSALNCAQKVLERIHTDDFVDDSVISDMDRIVEECKSRLPKNLDVFIEDCYNDYDNRSNRVYKELFGEPVLEEVNSDEEFYRRELKRLKKVYESCQFEYGFLTQDKFINFFDNPNSIYDNGSIWNFCYEHCVCYTDILLEFEILFRNYFDYRFYKKESEGAPPARFHSIWPQMREKYVGGKPYVSIDEMIADGRLEQFTAEEVMGALYYCTIYKERFCQGHFLGCCEDGIIGELLKQLKRFE